MAVSIIAVALLAVGCGGGDSDDEAADTPASTTPTETTDTASTTVGQANGDDDSTATTTEGGATTTAETASSGEDDGPGAQRAVVIIGGQTFDVDLSSGLSQCIALGGAIGGVGAVEGVDGASVDIDLPPEDYEASGDDWDPPSIRVDLGEDEDGVPIDWRAGGDLVADDPSLAGRSQVDSYSVDGTRASGTATFIDVFQVQLFAAGQVDEPQPVEGTFAIDCG